MLKSFTEKAGALCVIIVFPTQTLWWSVDNLDMHGTHMKNYPIYSLQYVTDACGFFNLKSLKNTWMILVNFLQSYIFKENCLFY